MNKRQHASKVPKYILLYSNGLLLSGVGCRVGNGAVCTSGSL